MRRLVRTGISGAAANVVDVASIIVFVEVVGMAVGFAAFVAAGVGASVNFLLSKFWAFDCKRPLHWRQVATYAGVALCTATLNGFAVHLGAVVIGVPYLLAWAVSAVTVFLVWSYPAQAMLVFAPQPAAARAITAAN